MADSSFIAKVTAELDTTSLKTDLAKFDGKIKVGIESNDINKINNQIDAIRKSCKEPIKLKLNIDGASSKEIKNLRDLLKDAKKYGIKNLGKPTGKGSFTGDPKDIQLKKGYGSKVFNTQDLSNKNIDYITKSYKNADKMIERIKSHFGNKAVFPDIVDVDSVQVLERMEDRITKFSVTAKDAQGKLKKFNYEAAKIQGTGKAQKGYINTSTSTVDNSKTRKSEANGILNEQKNRIKQFIQNQREIKKLKDLGRKQEAGELQKRNTALQNEYQKANQKLSKYNDVLSKDDRNSEIRKTAQDERYKLDKKDRDAEYARQQKENVRQQKETERQAKARQKQAENYKMLMVQQEQAEKRAEKKSNTDKVNGLLKEQEKTLSNIGKKRQEIYDIEKKGFDSSAQRQQLKNLNDEYKARSAEIKTANNVNGENVISDKDIRSRLKTYGDNVQKEYSAQVDKIDAKIAQSQERQLQRIEGQYRTSKFSAESSKMTSKLADYEGQSSESLERAKQSAKEYQQILENLGRHYDVNDSFKMSDSEIVSSFDRMKQSAEQFKNEMNIVGQTMSKNLKIGEAEAGANNVLAYMQENTRATKKYGQQLRELATEYQNVKTVEEKATLDKKFSNMKSSIIAEGLTGKSRLDNLKGAMKRVAEFMTLYTNLDAVMMDAPRMIFDNVKQVDSAMVELRKVSSAPDNQIANYFKVASESAQEYGSTVTDIINSTADWSRLGYGLEESSELAKVTALYQNVGDNIDQETASQSLISTLKGFELEANQAESVIDSFNEVSNNFAISSDGIGNALQRSAASFNTANASLNESIALITGANTIAQDPDRVGNMWKTVSARIRGASTELQEMGEESDNVLSTSKLRDLVKGYTGFDIMVDKAGTQYKSMYDIIVGIGEEWENLNDIQQAGLLESLAGKNQSNILAGAFQNVDIIKEAYATAENSAGSAQKENLAYMNSIEAKEKKLQATFQSFSTNLVSSDLFKGAIDSANGFLNVLNSIVETAGTLPLIFSGAGMVGFFKNLDSLKNIGGSSKLLDGFSKLKKNDGDVFDVFGENSDSMFKKLGKDNGLKQFSSIVNDVNKGALGIDDAISQLRDGVGGNDSISDLAMFFKSVGKDSSNFEKFAKDAGVAEDKIKEIKTAMEGAENSGLTFGQGLSEVFAGLGATLAPIAPMIIAAGVAIAGISGVLYMKNKENTLVSDAQARIQKINEQKESLESLSNTFKDLKKSQNDTNLSDEERYKVNSQLLDIQNQLVDTYGKQAQGIDLINGSYETQLDLINQLTYGKNGQYAQWLAENSKAASIATREMENEQRVYSLGNPMENEKFEGKTANKIVELMTSEGLKFDSGEYKIVGNATEVNEHLTSLRENLMALQAESGEDLSSVIDKVTSQITDSQSVIDKYGEDYIGALMGSMVQDTSTQLSDNTKNISELYQDYAQSVTDYNNALLTGDDQAIKTAQDKFDSLKSIVDNDVMSDNGSAKKYKPIFEDITNGLNKSADASQRFSDAMDNPKEGSSYAVKHLGEEINNLKKLNLDDVKFLDALSTDGVQEGEQQIRQIALAAKDLGLITGTSAQEVQPLIDKLIQLGTISGKVSDGVTQAYDKISDLSGLTTAQSYDDVTEAGAGYDEYVARYKKIQEAEESGFTHTKENEANKRLFSKDGTLSGYDGDKAKRYFTEDDTGVKNFISDMKDLNLVAQDKNGFITLGQNFKTIDQAAEKAGLSTEEFYVAMGKATEYKGGMNPIIASFGEGQEIITGENGLVNQLQQAQRELKALKDEDNGTEKNKSAIAEKQKEIAQYRETIKDVQKQMLEFSKQDIADGIENTKNAQNSLKNNLKEYNDAKKQFGDTTEGQAFLSTYKSKLESQAKEFGFTISEIDGELVLDTEEAQKKKKELEEEGVAGSVKEPEIVDTGNETTDSNTNATLANTSAMDSLTGAVNNLAGVMSGNNKDSSKNEDGTPKGTAEGNGMPTNINHPQDPSTLNHKTLEPKKNEVVEREQDKADKWGQEVGLPTLGNVNDLRKNTKFGNINMNDRPFIQWDDNTKKQFGSALRSWDYNPEVGSHDTVHGNSARYGEDINGKGVEIAFTPMMKDANGKPQFLNKDTVDNYINDIVKDSTTNGQIDTSKILEKDNPKNGGKGLIGAADTSMNYNGNDPTKLNQAMLTGMLMHFGGNYGGLSTGLMMQNMVTNGLGNTIFRPEQFWLNGIQSPYSGIGNQSQSQSLISSLWNNPNINPLAPVVAHANELPEKYRPQNSNPNSLNPYADTPNNQEVPVKPTANKEETTKVGNEIAKETSKTANTKLGEKSQNIKPKLDKTGMTKDTEQAVKEASKKAEKQSKSQPIGITSKIESQPTTTTTTTTKKEDKPKKEKITTEEENVITVTADTSEAASAIEEINSEELDDKTANLDGVDNASPVIAMWNGLSPAEKLAVLSAIDNASPVIENIESSTEINDKDVSINATDNATAKANNAKNAINSVKGKTVTVAVRANTSGASSAKSAIASVRGKTVEVKVKYTKLNNPPKGVGGGATGTFLSGNPLVGHASGTFSGNAFASGTVGNNSSASKIERTIKKEQNKNRHDSLLQAKRENFKLDLKKKKNISQARNAYASGSKVGVDKDQIALINELGRELIVRNGQAFTINNGDPSYARLKKGDVIFNHKQTEELEKYGRVKNGHAKVVGGDGAFAQGTLTKTGVNAYSSGTKADKKYDAFQKWLGKLFDWAEISLKKISTQVKQITTEAKSTLNVANKLFGTSSYGNGSKNNDTTAQKMYEQSRKLYQQAINLTTSQIVKQNQASGNYEVQANEVLSEAKKQGVLDAKTIKSVKRKVADGSLDISRYSEKQQTAINAYRDYYDKALEAKGAVSDLYDTQAELYDQWANAPYDHAIAKIEEMQKGYAGLLAIQKQLSVSKSGFSAQAKMIQRMDNVWALFDRDVNPKTYNNKVKSKLLNNSNLSKEQLKQLKAGKQITATDNKNSENTKDLINTYNKTLGKTDFSTTEKKYNKLNNILTNKNKENTIAQGNFAKAKGNITKSSFYNKLNKKQKEQYDSGTKITLTKKQKKDGKLQNAVTSYNKGRLSSSNYSKLTASQKQAYKNGENITLTKKQKNDKKLDKFEKTINSYNKKNDEKKTKLSDKETQKLTKKQLDQYKKNQKITGKVDKSIKNKVTKYNNKQEKNKKTGIIANDSLYKKLSKKQQAKIDKNEKITLSKSQKKTLSKSEQKKITQYNNTNSKAKKTQNAKTNAQKTLNPVKTLYNAQKTAKENAKIANNPLRAAFENMGIKGYNSYTDVVKAFQSDKIKDYDITNALIDSEVKALDNERKEKRQTYNDTIKSYNNAVKKEATKKQNLKDNTKTVKGLKGKVALTAAQKKAISEGKQITMTKEQKNNKNAKKAIEAYNKSVIEYNNSKTELSSQVSALKKIESEYAQAEADYAEKAISAEKEKFDTIKGYYEDYLTYLQSAHKEEQKMQLAQARGNKHFYGMVIDENGKVTKATGTQKSTYDTQKENLEEEIAKSEEGTSALNKQMKEIMAKSGYDQTIYKDTQEWRDLQTEINNSTKNTTELKIKLAELNKAAEDNRLYVLFEESAEKATKLIDAMKTINGLIAEESKYNKDGNLTSFGLVSVAMQVEEYQKSNEKIKTYLSELNNVINSKDDYIKEQSEDAWYDKQDEIKANIRQALSEAGSANSELVKIIEQSAQQELDSLGKVIDKRKEALAKKREYYEYDRQLKNQNKEIQLLEQQARALEGVSDAESKANLARIKAQLEEAKEAQDDALQEHLYNIQVEGLDELSENISNNFEEYIKELYTDTDKMETAITSLMQTVVNSAGTIDKTIVSILKKYGITDVKQIGGENVSGNITVAGQKAKGTRRVTRSGIYEVNEEGQEVKLSKGILEPLGVGDIVFTREMSQNLWKMANEYPNLRNGNIKAIPNSSYGTIVNNSYDSLLNVQGDVTKDALPSLQVILKESYKYMVQEQAKDLRKSGRRY